jgi:hypothetical protein
MNKVFSIRCMLFITLLLFQCGKTMQQPRKPINGLCEITYKKDFEKDFILHNDLTYNIKKEVNINKSIVKIDSGYDLNSLNDSIKYFIIKDNQSKLVVVQFGYQKKNYRYDIVDLEISSNLIEFKNGLKINMKKSDFFEMFNYAVQEADMVDISLGRQGFYYRCKFRNDRLIMIKKQYILR